MLTGAGSPINDLLNDAKPRMSSRNITVEESKPRIAAVILAAGRSTRMGSINKLLAPVEGMSMVGRVVNTALASLKEVFVVTGHEGETVEQALAGRPVTLVRNRDFAAGMSTSLKCGVAALRPEIDGALILLGDMPYVSADIIEQIMRAFAAERSAIIVPTHQGKRGNPILWPRRFFTEMQEISGDVGARQLIVRHADQVREVDVGSAAIFIDVDTPGALQVPISR